MSSRFLNAFTSHIVLDLRHVSRRMTRAPWLTAVVVLTLSVGVGASTAVFSVVKGVLLEPLPYPDAERLVRIVETIPPGETPQGAAEERVLMDEQRFFHWRGSTSTLSQMGAYVTAPVTIETAEGASRAVLARASPSIFPMLGARMKLGRPLLEPEERADSRVVLLSPDAWTSYFGASTDVVGRTVMLDGIAHTVVGVLEHFGFPSDETQFWIPFVREPAAAGRERFVNVVARLREGVSWEEAAAEADVIGRRVAAATRAPDPVQPQVPRYRLERLQAHMTTPVAPALRLFMFAALLVMLIVTANVLTLLLSRSTRHRQETVIQRALGASRSRVIRQILMEAGIFGFAGAILGLALSYGSLEVLKALARVDLPELFQLAARQQFGSGSVFPRLDEIGIDVEALMFAILIAFLASMSAGLGPALQIVADERRSFLDTAFSRPAAISQNGARLRNALVVGQVVVATTLLVAAALLIRSFVQMSRRPMGYDPKNVLSFQLVPPPQYPLARKELLAHEFATRLSELPGVVAAGFASLPPLAGGAFAYGVFQPPGRTLQEMLRDPYAPQARSVSRGYLRAMGVRLLEGRWFDEADGPDNAQVLLVTRALARRYFGSRSPISVQVRLLPAPRPWTIIGIVDDLHNGMPWEAPYSQFFMDPRQALHALPHLPERMRETAALGFLSYAVRVNGEPADILPDVRAVLRQLERSAALDGAMPLRDIASGRMSRPRFYAVCSGLLALVAAVLGIVGVYATVAYATALRTREFGIRIALGAQRSAVLRVVLSHGTALTAVGVAGGLCGAFLLSGSLAGMLFGMTSTAPWTYGSVGFVFFGTAVAATFVPALRATRVDPVTAIRHE